MNYSSLLKQLLERAEEIHKSSDTQAVSAPCLVIAMLNFCNENYSGITPLDQYTCPEWYEEERLRYLCQKLFKHCHLSASLFLRMLLKEEYRQYDSDFFSTNITTLETEMRRRNRSHLSADLAFLVAIRSIKPEHRLGVSPEYKGEIDIAACMEDIDRNIHNYVIASIGNLQQKLQEKVDQAKKQRDWRPAPKFTEPETLRTMFLGAIRIQKDGDDLLMQIPHFFGDEDALDLYFRFWNGYYYVHDWGCALTQLRKHTENEAHFRAVYQRIAPNLSVEDGRIVGAFLQPHLFFHYLQVLIFTAHGDLYWEQLDEQGLYYDPDHSFPAQSEPLVPQSLCDLLQEDICCYYDEDTGLSLGFPMCYSLNSTRVSYRIETLPDGIRISDNRAGMLEGEILESFYWDHEDLSRYRRFVAPYLARFGGELRGKELSLAATAEEILPALFRFINLAVLCSELGRLIDLPEVEE